MNAAEKDTRFIKILLLIPMLLILLGSCMPHNVLINTACDSYSGHCMTAITIYRQMKPWDMDTREEIEDE